MAYRRDAKNAVFALRTNVLMCNLCYLKKIDWCWIWKNVITLCYGIVSNGSVLCNCHKRQLDTVYSWFSIEFVSCLADKLFIFNWNIELCKTDKLNWIESTDRLSTFFYLKFWTFDFLLRWIKFAGEAAQSAALIISHRSWFWRFCRLARFMFVANNYRLIIFGVIVATAQLHHLFVDR